MQNKVLIVEDEHTTGDILKMALESEGIEVDWVDKGGLITEVFDRGKYDLIVLDLKLPELNGDQVLEHVRKVDPYVLVVVYTNYEETPVMKKLINLGVDAFIHKGAKADLWNTVETIKQKLEPFTPEEFETLQDALPDTFPFDPKGGASDE